MRNACTLLPEASASHMHRSMRPTDFVFSGVRWRGETRQSDGYNADTDCLSPLTTVSGAVAARGAGQRELVANQSSCFPRVKNVQSGNDTPVGALTTRFRDSFSLEPNAGDEQRRDASDMEELEMADLEWSPRISFFRKE
ncbi:hypothetical protein KEM54_003958 [Ascosphaera aggregata]|nr:hypothetical protein KEM54_003958 [Ascosphaera aggregata]